MGYCNLLFVVSHLFLLFIHECTSCPWLAIQFQCNDGEEVVPLPFTYNPGFNCEQCEPTCRDDHTILNCKPDDQMLYYISPTNHTIVVDGRINDPCKAYYNAKVNAKFFRPSPWVSFAFLGESETYMGCPPEDWKYSSYSQTDCKNEGIEESIIHGPFKTGQFPEFQRIPTSCILFRMLLPGHNFSIQYNMTDQCQSSGSFFYDCPKNGNKETPVNAPQIPPENGKMRLLGAIIAASFIGTLVLISVVLFRMRRDLKDKFTQDNKSFETFLKSYSTLAPKRYTYSGIKKMTYSFKEKLGEGGYSGVYKGKLPDGRLVAVKLLKHAKGNGEDFINEVASISRTNHINVVTLLGFCCEGRKRVLVYEFMENGSLEKFANDGTNCGQTLPLETLFRIVLGTARGLEYLHQGCKTRILHFDIKPHNILLDKDFCPKISDFGLAKVTQQTKQSKVSMSGTRGTIGYISPEMFCRNFGDVSHKSDVYSYGMMVLEMIGSRKRQDAKAGCSSELIFPQWIYEQLEAGEALEVDGITQNLNDEEKRLKSKMIIVSLWCIQTVPSCRPSMSNVLRMLEGSLESIHIPPMPSLSSPPRTQFNPSGSSTTTP